MHRSVLSFFIPGCCSSLLRYLCIRENNQITSPGLCELLAKSKFLRVLDASRCGMLTDDVLLTMAASCPSLRALSISKNAVMTDRGLVPLAQSGRELHRIKMDETKMTSASILAITQNCLSMQMLDASGCIDIPENSIKAAARVSAVPRLCCGAVCASIL